MRQNTLGPAAPLVAALAQLIPIRLQRWASLFCMATRSLQKLGKNRPRGLSYC
jgi:hypothetical protein